ncbi:BTAD domain-containing putative transcriptional regulator [Nocardioides caricicola]|uniref:BTAD domain-containing putative transcriptional regulator n=1 Tax=Nocardioides caricicola TaxID=634770 RepID=A0ABW0N0V1_9ACTN
MRIGVLGTTSASDDAGPVNLGGLKQRALLAVLALHRGRAVPADTIADLIWDGSPPPGVSGTLQGYVAGLRRALEPDRKTRGGGNLLVTESPGYALRLADQDLDTAAFESAVSNAHTQVVPLADALCRGRALPAGSPDATGLTALHQTIDEALALWRGVPFADLGDAPAAEAERARLEELRVLAVEDRAALGILLGLHATVAAELDALTRQHPLRERAWSLRALALARSGRQADALAVLRQVRDVLDEELGLEPGPELRAVQAAVLRQETAATAEPAPAPPAAPGRAPADPDEHAPLPFPTLWGWSLAGRDDELAALRGLVDSVVATGGSPAFAALTGDPGIGKSRLTIETAAYAAEQGMTIAWGRCSQDDGAPALWPWATVLERLGSELPSSGDSDDSGAAFRAWEIVVQRVLAAATEQPLMLVIDDLHWADTSSLRVLRLLTEAAVSEGGVRLLVVTTWREHPPPQGALAEVAEALGRKHALRLQLRGISADATAQVFQQVSETAPTEAEIEALRRRTEGNPFFLVEYARLARERGDLAALMAEAQPPAAVHEVLSRRLAQLGDDTRDVLRSASVIGRIFELGTLAGTVGSDEDAVLDALDPALAAGLVDEDGVDRFRFTHALVRDTVLNSLPESRRARVHARAATALTDRSGHEAEIARHWLAAGPRHARDAWRAAQAAAQSATAVYAYVEALEMLEHALRTQEEDLISTEHERFEILADLADVLRRAGRWIELRGVTHEAIEVADEAGDVDLLVRAGEMTSIGSLWTPAGGEVDDLVVDALRRALDGLPEGDDPRRCRVMLALAGEIYYGATAQEREALAEEAVAMARRLGDKELLIDAALKASIAIWNPHTADLRLELAGEAATLARELGDHVWLTSALTLQAVAAGELGDIAVLDECLAAGRAEADRVRHVYAHLLLDSIETAWAAMRGQFDEAAKHIEHLAGLGELVSIVGYDESVAGALLMQALWSGELEAVADGVIALTENGTFLPLATSRLTMLCRVGRIDEARAWYAEHRAEVESTIDINTWFLTMALSMGAEAACYLEDRELAATTYERLSGLAGRPACAGSGTVVGPVDIFLAMAAHATGEAELAARHADRAVELCETWDVPLATDWVRRERERWGF